MDQEQEQEQIVVEEPQQEVVQTRIGSKTPSVKFTSLIMTLFPLSIANWVIFAVVYLLLVYFVVPYKIDNYAGELVPDWKTGLPFALALYFPISFAFHYITKSGLA